MRINLLRVIGVISSALLLVAVCFAFFVSPYAGSAYLRITRKLGSELPLITKNFSLAFMRNAENPFADFSETQLWVGCLWFILICWPIALMIWAIRAPDFERSMAKWCLGMIAYLAMGVTVAVIVSAGLVMPFAGLK